jgi:hypothetical protein
MTDTILASDTWIVNQLIGIKILEKELTSAVEDGGDHPAALRDRVAALNSWLDLLDHTLNAKMAATHGSRRAVGSHRRLSARVKN